MTKNATSIYKYLDDEKINYQIVMHPPGLYSRTSRQVCSKLSICPNEEPLFKK